MILIITHKEDYTADFVINQLNNTGIDYLRLNCEDLLTVPLYQIATSNSLRFQICDQPSFTSVWYRRTMIPALEGLSPAESLYFTREFEALLDNLYPSLSNCRWLSSPFQIRQAENKLLQLRLAHTVGMLVPETLVTNDKTALQKFFDINPKTIIKPLYSGYVPQNGGTALFFTNVISREQMADLSLSDLTPCIYQRYIEKDFELRITVVSDQVFAARVDSQANEVTAIDWRRSKARFSAFDLPERVAKQCILLCQKLNISFGAIDIIVDPNGNYWFLEINPNGQWAWIEMDTGLPIANEIISYLNNHNDGR